MRTSKEFYIKLKNVSIEFYAESDKDELIALISDLQEVERAITDTCRPGPEISEAYFKNIQEKIENKQGAIFIVKNEDTILGFISCWIEEDDNITETKESNKYGYISDIY